MSTLQKGDKKLLNAWAFYDWANSVYPLVISSSIFPLFYKSIFPDEKKEIFFIGFHFKSTALISFITVLAFIAISILSPLLSGIADYVGNKKRFLQFFCYLGAFSCIGIYWFDANNLYFGLSCFFFGLIGFWGSLVFYNSYLPDVAFSEQQDGLSAKGYAMGYLGSLILLAICLFMVMSAKGSEMQQAMRLSFVLTGIWWILFSQYTFYNLPKGNSKNNKITNAIIFNGFKELVQVKNQLFQNLKLKLYLIAFFVYSMAVQTVILVASYFGEEEITWGSDNEKIIGLIISIILIQLLAAIGAFLTSKAAKKYGNINVLIVLSAFFGLICILGYFLTTPIHFYITAAFVGLVMGGIQALSRSTYSKFLPNTQDTTSFFSFYDVTEKIAIVIGMSVYGYIDQLTGSTRNSIVSLAIFFILGMFLLLRVPKNKEVD